MRIDVSGLKKAVVLLLVALACDIAATAPACTCLQCCCYLHSSAVLLLLALVCRLAATCTCLQFCCCLQCSAVMLLLALICSVAATAATCFCLHYLYLSAVLLLLAMVCRFAAACTHLHFCWCPAWATPDWYPHVYRSTAAAHSHQGCRSETMHHGKVTPSSPPFVDSCCQQLQSLGPPFWLSSHASHSSSF